MRLAANALLTIAITHVTVIDTTGGPARADMTVQIAGDRITSVGPAAGAAIPEGAQVIDGTGKFLIPGLWDMHIHAFFGDWVPGGREATLPLFVANGVTGVRDMGSDLEPILAARRDVEQGTLLGPRMVISGPMLDGPKSQFPAAIAIATPEEGRRAVAMLQGRGVDFIKIQSYVPREAYLAIADECRKRKIRFEGHVPDAMRASEASADGQASFEHLIGVFEGSSTEEEAFLEGKKGPARFLETWNSAREASLAGLLAKNGTWQCPTLFWERGQWLVDAIDVSKDPDAKYAPVYWREKSWPTFAKGILESMATDPLPVRQRFVEHELEIVKRLQRSGVPFLAGTDTPAGVDVIPGFSLHRELERFVDAGFTPMEALQTATTNPAKFLGRSGDFGTVKTGRMADLVLLDANPLDDIRNTQKIAAVVANGRYLARSQLDGILAQVAAYSREAPKKKLALVGGMLLDGSEGPPLHHAAILIEGNRIVRVGPAAGIAIPEDTEVIDTSGRTMLPGLIDTHAHLQILGHGDYDRWDPWIAENKLVERVSEISAKQLLMAGVTSAVDLGGTLKESLAVRDRINSGAVAGPRMWMSGPWITRDLGGYSPALANQLLVDTPAEAAKAVEDLAREGVDVIKAYVKLGPAHYKAIADTAHRHGLRVHAHVYDPVNVRDAFEAGIDVLQHVGSAGVPTYDPALVAAIAAKGTPVVVTAAHRAFLFPATVAFPERLRDPQLKADFGPQIWDEVQRSFADFQRLSYFSETAEEMRLANASLRQWIRSGATMGMGTDSGTPMNFHTEALWREIKAHVDTGMPPQRAIMAATRVNAGILGKGTELGTIEPGKLADVIVVRGDPLFDVTALANVEVVVKDGVVYKGANRGN